MKHTTRTTCTTRTATTAPRATHATIRIASRTASHAATRVTTRATTRATPRATSDKTAAPAPNKTTSSDAAFFAEETDIANEARRQAVEVITRVLIWIAEGANAPSREARATIALYCVRPDLIESPTLAQIGHAAGISEAAACKLAHDFHAGMGL